MANKRNKNKLNAKQSNIISLVISAIYFIYTCVNGIMSEFTRDQAIYYWSISCFVGTVFVYVVFYYFIFKGEEKSKEERENKIKIETIQQLSYTDFKQVYFFPKRYEGDNIAMMRQILKKEGCEFYAKLMQNKNINLIAKDKYNEEVYNVEIENISYFNSNFKIKK